MTRTLRIHRHRGHVIDGGGLVFGEPENAGLGPIDLPRELQKPSEDIASINFEEKMLRASSYKDSDLVFATGKGTPLDTQNIVNHHFKRLLERAGFHLFVGTI